MNKTIRLKKLGDIALLLDPKKRGLLPLVRVTKVERGLDAKIRRVTVFDRFTHFPRAITSLAVLVPADNTEDEDVSQTAQYQPGAGQ
jgi:hypothetical protein